MLDSLYENIGGKIKTLAVWTFIVEAIGAIITGIILASEEDVLYIFIAICGPIIAWVSSWLLYAFGELVEKMVGNESNTKKILEKLERNVTEEKNMERNINQTYIKNENVKSKQTTDEHGFVIQNDTLIKYNGNDINVTVPDMVVTLREQAFLNNKRIVSVVLSENVTTVSEWVFYNCKNLEKIHIPNSVVNIGENAFYGCDKLYIHAPVGSYAEQYAKENNMPFVAE